MRNINYKKIIISIFILFVVGILFSTPINSSIINNLSPSSITFDIYFGTTNPPPKIVSNQTETTYNPGILEHEKTYYWRIVAWDEFGNWADGPIWHFTTIANQAPVAIIIAPSNGYKKEDIIFDGSDSYDPDGYIINYNWDFGDGVVDNGIIVTHQFQQSKTYNVILVVEDDDGNTDQVDHDITINNRAPVAYFVADQYYIQPGDTVTFDGTGSYDPDGDNLDYSWEIYGNVIGTDPIISYTFYDYGNYEVSLTVTDDDVLNPMSDMVSAMIFVNSPPIAEFTYYPQNPFVGDWINFNGSLSYDPDGTIVNYSWDFGDTEFDYGMIVDHRYLYNGWFTITLTVEDDMGDFGIYSEDIYVQGVDIFEKMQSYDILNFSKMEKQQFTELKFQILYQPRPPSNPYPENGSVDVPIDVILTWTCSENNPPVTPIISGETNGLVGEEYEYCIDAIVDPDGDSLWVFWDWGDGTNTGWLGPFVSGEEMCANHSWDEIGTYIIKAQLKDDYGAYSEWGYLEVSMPKNNLMQKLVLKYLLLKFPNILTNLKYPMILFL